MNIHDIQAQIEDLKGKAANATGDEKSSFEAKIKQLEEQAASGGTNIKDDVSHMTDDIKNKLP